jgi:hypothetical protein
MEQTLAGLRSRVFLLNNVHEDAPEVFETRWALSYLRGPLTRSQIKTLMDSRRGRPDAAGQAKTTAAAASTGAPGGPRPVLPPGLPQLFVPARGKAGERVYHPAVLGVAEVHFDDAKSGVASTQRILRTAEVADPVDWSEGGEPDFALEDLESEPESGARFADPGPAASQPKTAEAWAKDFARWIYREKTLELFRSPSSRELSQPGETEAEFRGRLQQGARETRDAAAERLRQKYAPKLAALQERLRRAEQSVAREKQESQQAGIQTAISVGATVLGALFGRKVISSTTIGRATTAAKTAGRTMKQAGDVGRAKETVGAVEQQIQELDAELASELAASQAATDPATERLETVTLRPKKTDVTVRRVALLWRPETKS